MHSAQFIKFKRLPASAKKSNFKKASLPMFIKHRDLGLVSFLHSPLDIFQQFLLKILNSVTLEISNWNYLVLLPPPSPPRGRPNRVDNIWWSTLTGSNRLWSNGFHVVIDIRIKDICFSSTSKTKLKSNKIK